MADMEYDDLIAEPDVSVTSAESAALSRLSANKDFNLLIEVLARWQKGVVHRLIIAPQPNQTDELIRAQGGHKLLLRMLKFIDEATPPPQPRKR